jgi:hypothetical protein
VCCCAALGTRVRGRPHYGNNPLGDAERRSERRSSTTCSAGGPGRAAARTTSPPRSVSPTPDRLRALSSATPETRAPVRRWSRREAELVANMLQAWSRRGQSDRPAGALADCAAGVRTEVLRQLTAGSSTCCTTPVTRARHLNRELPMGPPTACSRRGRDRRPPAATVSPTRATEPVSRRGRSCDGGGPAPDPRR